MSRKCPITGAKVLYLHCLDCSGKCKIADSYVFPVNDSYAADIQRIKNKSVDLKLNVHTWTDSSIFRAWKMFSDEFGRKNWIETNESNLSAFYTWLLGMM